MSSQSFKQQLFDQFAHVAKALSNGHRLDLLEFLAQGERSVETLSKRAGLSFANTSQHLQQLRRAGLVLVRKDGQHVIYRLADESVVSLLSLLRVIAERNLAEVGRLVHKHLTAKDNFEPISAQELQQRLRDGVVTVVDVRPTDEYAAGHLPHALNIPLEELDSHLETLPRDQEIVAYCRGPYCVLAYEAVASLRKKGFKALRLETGYPEWKQAGLPVETDVDH